MPEPVSAKPVPKLRAKSASKPPGRPRPKTIHVDQDADVNSALGSRGPRGSISNISGKIDEPFYYCMRIFVFARGPRRCRREPRVLDLILFFCTGVTKNQILFD